MLAKHEVGFGSFCDLVEKYTEKPAPPERDWRKEIEAGDHVAVCD